MPTPAPALRHAVPEILELAARELGDTAAWYEEQRPGYGSLFLEEAETAFEFIDGSPLAGPPWVLDVVPEGTRHIVLRTFPISIVYVTEPRVVVVAIVGSQKPSYWIDRLDEIE